MDDAIKLKQLMQWFEQKEHNMIVFGDIDARKYIRGLALRFGVDYEEAVSSQPNSDFSALRSRGPGLQLQRR